MRLRPRKLPFRKYTVRSAVAVIYRNSKAKGPELLLIERAQREGDPWSGHMAFPGGKVQANDANTLSAAIRETWEEIGLDINLSAQYKGRLTDLLTRRHNHLRPMVVTPYLFELLDEVELNFNHEVADTVWIPFDFFIDKSNRSSMKWKAGSVNLKMPCYYYQNKCIWGLTYLMLKDLINDQLNPL